MCMRVRVHAWIDRGLFNNSVYIPYTCKQPQPGHHTGRRLATNMCVCVCLCVCVCVQTPVHVHARMDMASFV
jgi:hypothetical protein